VVSGLARSAGGLLLFLKAWGPWEERVVAVMRRRC
jgi:hypothetical protein